MKVKKIGNGQYATSDKKYAIQRTFDGGWSIYKDVGRIDNNLEYVVTYKYLKEAKKHIEDICR